MRQILSDIRALPGVTGVAVIAKRNGRVEHLFPAAFTERHTQFLRDLITSTYQRLRGFTRLALRFERVVVHLYNQPDFLLFVTTLPDIDARQFEMIVNSKFGSISRALGKADSAAPGAAARGTRTAAAAPSPSATSGEAVTRLMAACNSLTDQLADSRGRLRLANDWRKARETANDGTGALDALMIDAAGRLQVRKGHPLPANASSVAAFAALIDGFLDSLEAHRSLAEEELYMLLRPHRGILEPAGFFLYLEQRTRAKAAR